MKRILTIEDDPDLRGLLTTILEDEGYAVDAVTNDDEALARIRQVAPDVILASLESGPTSRRAFVAACRQDVDSARIPIALLTAAVQVVRVRDLPVDGLIVMPFELDALLAEVARLAASTGDTALPAGSIVESPTSSVNSVTSSILA